MIPAVLVGAVAYANEILTREGVTLCVPERNIFHPSGAGLPKFHGREPLLIFKFLAHEVAAVIPSYVSQREKAQLDLIGELDVLSDAQRERTLAINNYEDLWTGTGAFQNWQTTFNKDLGLFKASPQGEENPKNWVLLNVFPDASRPMPKSQFEFVVATCHATDVPMHDGVKRVGSCGRRIFFDRITIDYSLHAENSRHIFQIDALLKEKVMSWKSACQQ